MDPLVVPDFDTLSKNQWCSLFKYDVEHYMASLGKQAPAHTLTDIIASGKFSPSIENNLNYQLKNAVEPGAETCTDAYTDRKRIAFLQHRGSYYGPV